MHRFKYKYNMCGIIDITKECPFQKSAHTQIYNALYVMFS